MLKYLIFGITYAFACAVQPGPFQVFIVSRTLTHGWRRALPAAIAPLISDGPIILVVLLVLQQMPAWLEPALFCGGGAFLLFLSFRSFQAWREPGPPPSTDGKPGYDTLWKAAMVNFLNPNPWLGWSLVMGPFFLAGWRTSPLYGLTLLISFYTTMAVVTGAIILLVSATGKLGPRVSRWMVGFSALALFLFGCYALGRGILTL